MGIFVFSTKKPMVIAANMNEKLRNVVLVAGLFFPNELDCVSSHFDTLPRIKVHMFCQKVSLSKNVLRENILVQGQLI